MVSGNRPATCLNLQPEVGSAAPPHPSRKGAHKSGSLGFQTGCRHPVIGLPPSRALRLLQWNHRKPEPPWLSVSSSEDRVYYQTMRNDDQELSHSRRGAKVWMFSSPEYEI